MDIANTPAHSFENLPGYDFSGKYFEVEKDLSVHFLDEGPADGEVVLCMHGEPSWSYLYRKMIPVFAAVGYRVLAPDLVGFGKSSKPMKQSDYTYAKHLNWMLAWFDHLDLTGVNMFCQDWGGLIGLRMATSRPDRFNRIVVANTGLPTGDQKMPEAFMKWQAFSQKVPVLPVGTIIQSSTTTELSEDIVKAYEAPYPTPDLQAGAKIFPSLVPTRSDDPESQNNRDAWEIFKTWNKPFLTLFSDKDPITKGGERVFQSLIPGAKGQPHQTIENAGHFLQEDKGEEIAEIMIQWMSTT